MHTPLPKLPRFGTGCLSLSFKRFPYSIWQHDFHHVLIITFDEKQLFCSISCLVEVVFIQQTRETCSEFNWYKCTDMVDHRLCHLSSKKFSRNAIRVLRGIQSQKLNLSK